MTKTKKRNFSHQNSLVRLWVCDENDNKEVFYSFSAEDKKGYEYVLRAMKERILSKMYRNRFKVAIFYNNTRNSKLETITPQKIAQNFTKSKVKLLIFDRANNPHTLFSSPDDNTESLEYIVGKMYERHIKGVGINAAMFYDMATGDQVAKFGAYGRQA